jgi:4-hydroxy-tetrahydrodipicolinate reductase
MSDKKPKALENNKKPKRAPEPLPAKASPANKFAQATKPVQVNKSAPATKLAPTPKSAPVAATAPARPALPKQAGQKPMPLAPLAPKTAGALKSPQVPLGRPAGPPAPPKPAAKKHKPANGAAKVGVVGCAGRMGQMLLKLLIHAPGIVVVGGTERRGSAALGRDLGALAGVEPLGISVSDDPAPLFSQADVVVDFTNPSTTVQHAALAAKTGCALVIGTTGFDNDQLAALNRAAIRAPIILAANMSLGVNLLQQVVEEVARILDADWDIEILEMHHRHKVDAPSGTALALGEAAARGRAQQLRRIQRRHRDGQIGPRVKGEIGFASLRGGDVVGDHTVIFAAEGERVEISHRASSREIFGRGAVKAVLWAFGRRPGLYSMRDVLGFSVPAPNGET